MLGRRLREARLEMGLTQEALAEPNLTKDFVSSIERGLATPPIHVLEQLAQRLGKPLSYFLEDRSAVTSDEALDSLYGAGRSALLCGRHEAALLAFSELHTRATSQRSREMSLRGALGMGEALLELRRLEEARAKLEDVLTAAAESRDRLAEGRALHALATVALRSGNPPRAADLYRRALVTVSALAEVDPVFHGEIWLYLSTALFRMGRLDESWDACVRAQQLFENSIKRDRLAEVHLNLGVILYKTGDYQGALAQYERARAMLDRSDKLRLFSHVLNNIGMVLLDMGRPGEAIALLSASLAIKQRLRDTAGECRTLTEIARCLLGGGDVKQAREYALRAISLGRESGVPNELARTRIVLGMIASKEGHVRKAQRYLGEAAVQCEQFSMVFELVAVYRELAHLAAARGKYREATEYHEKAFKALPTSAPCDIVGALHLSDIVASQPCADAGGEHLF